MGTQEEPGWLSQFSDFAMDWTTGVQIPVGAMMRFFPFTTASRPALGPTQPPIQCIPGDSYTGGKAAGA
jgi:hypothetical protein